MKLKQIVFFVISWLLAGSIYCQQQTETQNTSKKTDGQTKPKAEPEIAEAVLGMNVSGNKESPNVLYIVPWKGADSAGKLPEISPLVDEVFAPIDPLVFSKKVKFYRQLTEKQSSQNKSE